MPTVDTKDATGAKAGSVSRTKVSQTVPTIGLRGLATLKAISQLSTAEMITIQK